VGVVYLLIGRVFAVPVDHPRAWRLAAWLLSGGVYAGHVGYERFGLHHSPRATALHAALAVAVGSFTLAVAGAIHTLSATATLQLSWLLALFVLPAAIAVPAFVVAQLVTSVLARLPGKTDAA
jgi:hypothetical protein